MKKILITGGSGRLGKEIVKEFPKADVPTKEELDLSKPQSITNYMEDKKYDILIHAGAKTGIPPCEEDKQIAFDTNISGTAKLANWFFANNPEGYFIYISTPCTFSGEEDEYSELSLQNPSSYYGLTKLGGEIAILTLGGAGFRTVVARTNFVPKEKWEHPKAFIDRYSNYLFASDVARGIKDLVNEQPKGVIHITGSKKLSMYELAMLCPDSKKVEKYTLEEYYKDNPDSGKLTKNMCLITNRGKTYDINGGENGKA